MLSDRYKIWQRANIVLSGPKSDFFWPNSFWAPRNPCPKFELFDLPLNYKGKVPKMIQNWLWRILNCQSCSRYLMVFSIRIGLVLIVFNCLAILTDLRILRIWSEYKQICQNVKPSHPTKIAWAWIRSLSGYKTLIWQFSFEFRVLVPTFERIYLSSNLESFR